MNAFSDDIRRFILSLQGGMIIHSIIVIIASNFPFPVLIMTSATDISRPFGFLISGSPFRLSGVCLRLSLPLPEQFPSDFQMTSLNVINVETD